MYDLYDTGNIVRLYRIIRRELPTYMDFLSGKALARHPPPTDPVFLRVWVGVSTYAALAQARGTAARYPRLGIFIAALDVPTTLEAFRIERSLGTVGHCTVWGDPYMLSSRIHALFPVEG